MRLYYPVYWGLSNVAGWNILELFTEVSSWENQEITILGGGFPIAMFGHPWINYWRATHKGYENTWEIKSSTNLGHIFKLGLSKNLGRIHDLGNHRLYSDSRFGVFPILFANPSDTTNWENSTHKTFIQI